MASICSSARYAARCSAWAVPAGGELRIGRARRRLPPHGKGVADQQQLHDRLDKQCMSRRTKIVATLGPAIGRRRRCCGAAHPAGVDVVRLNLSHGTLDEHLDRLAAVRAAATGVGRAVARARRPARAEGPLRGHSPTVACPPQAGARCGSCAGEEPSTASGSPSTTRRCSTTSIAGDRIVLGDGAIRCGSTSCDADGVTPTVLTSGRPVRAGPACTCRPERLRLTTPTAAGPRAARGGRRRRCRLSRGARSSGRRPTSSWCAAPRRRRAAEIVAKIETDPAVDNLERDPGRADAVMVARGDLGIECPLEDVPHVQKHIIRACVERGAGDHRHADAGDHDHVAGTDAGRGERRRQRGLRRHGRGDALGRDGHRPRPGRRGARPWRASPSGPRRRPTTSSGADGLGRVQRLDSPTRAPRRITQAITHAAWQAANDVGATAIVAAPAAGARRGPWRGSGRGAQLVGREPRSSGRCASSPSLGRRAAARRPVRHPRRPGLVRRRARSSTPASRPWTSSC